MTAWGEIAWRTAQVLAVASACLAVVHAARRRSSIPFRAVACAFAVGIPVAVLTQLASDAPWIALGMIPATALRPAKAVVLAWLLWSPLALATTAAYLASSLVGRPGPWTAPVAGVLVVAIHYVVYRHAPTGLPIAATSAAIGAHAAWWVAVGVDEGHLSTTAVLRRSMTTMPRWLRRWTGRSRSR